MILDRTPSLWYDILGYIYQRLGFCQKGKMKMVFRNDNDRQNFLADVSYCENKENYCLGSTFSSATAVIRELMHQAELEKEEEEGTTCGAV